MSVLQHFETQLKHFDDKGPCQDGVPLLFVLTDKTGPLEVFFLPQTELETFLEGTTFSHIAGLIPVFRKPKTTGKWMNPLKKEDGNN